MPAQDGLIRAASKYSVDETVRRLQETFVSKGLQVFAVIDHSGEAEKVGLKMAPTKVIIFGFQVTSDQAGASQRSVNFHIDSISVEGLATCPTPAGALPDAGASDASDGGASASDSADLVDAADAE